MKILFVAHDTGVYGGERSLQALVKHAKEQLDVWVAVPKRCYRKFDRKKLSEFYALPEEKIIPFYLPYGFFSDLIPPPVHSLRRKTKKFLTFIPWVITKSKFYRFLSQEQFDLIHLNSSVLIHCINAKYPFTIHIREEVNDITRSAIEKLRMGKGFIFIDELTQSRLQHLKLSNQIVLNNPFDMTEIEHLKVNDYPINFDPEKMVVFSMIGSIIENKGVQEVIKAFLRTNNTSFRLLIIGNGYRDSYYKTCRLCVEGDSRIHFFEEQEDVRWVYKISDYILRGECEFKIGRTIFEGLFSDCCVIIPGTKHNVESSDCLNNFQDKVLTYTPKSVDSLASVMCNLPSEKIEKKKTSTLTLAHISINFLGFTKQTLDCSRLQ